MLENRFEGGFVVDRDVGQDFAIESDPSGFQSLSEPAVSHSVRARGGVKPLDPKITERALPRFAIAIGPILAFHGRVFGVAEKFGSASAIALRGFDDAFAARAAGRRVGGSWHLLLCPARAGLLVQRAVPLIIDLSDLAR